MPNTFEKKFVTYCHEQELEVNINQIEVIKKLEKYFQNNFKSFFSELFSKQSLKKGFYLYGDVGVGKTMILNFFFNQVDEKKIRQHFNEFMLRFHDFVHEQKEKNSENVINQFVQNLKSKASLILLRKKNLNYISMNLCLVIIILLMKIKKKEKI